MNPNRNFILYFFLTAAHLFLSIGISYGQANESAKKGDIKIIDGRKYYVHTVVKGETLYGISDKYKVLVKDIVLENPLTINGLKVGGIIKIPVPFKIVETKTLDGKYIFHTVQAGETFYSLSRQYKMDIEILEAANPELVTGLKAGASIRIPIRRGEIKSLNEAKQLDTLGDESDLTQNPDSVIPVNNTLITYHDSKVFKDTYQIVMMLPLYLDMNEAIEFEHKIDDPVKIYEKSSIGVEFYEGAMLAVDSMRKQGYKAIISVYDTGHDTTIVNKLINEGKLAQADLLIGPLYQSNLLQVVDYARRHKIHVVSPFITTNKIILGNENLSKAKPCVQTTVEEIAKYIEKRYCNERPGSVVSKNIMIIHNEDSGELMLVNLLTDRLKSVANPTEPMIKVVKYKERGIAAVVEALSLADTNILIIPSGDQVFVSKVISGLNPKHEDYNIVVFGLPEWQYFNNLESDYLHNMNIHIASPSYIDYERDTVKQFIRAFVSHYKSYPGNYAFEGFDITWFYLNVLKNYGSKFQTYLPDMISQSLQTDFKYKKIDSTGGYENKNVFILSYQDYQLILASPVVY